MPPNQGRDPALGQGHQGREHPHRLKHTWGPPMTTLLRIAVLTAAVLATGIASAQPYPNRPVKLIVFKLAESIRQKIRGVVTGKNFSTIVRGKTAD
jgi:hypothetical protein